MCRNMAPVAQHSLAMHGSLHACKTVYVHVQAVVNEDLSGEAAAMLAEIARLSAQNASLKSEVALLQQARALHAFHLSSGQDGSGMHSTCLAEVLEMPLMRPAASHARWQDGAHMDCMQCHTFRACWEGLLLVTDSDSHALLTQAPGQAIPQMPAAPGSPFTTPLAKFAAGSPGLGGVPGSGLHFVSPVSASACKVHRL